MEMQNMVGRDFPTLSHRIIYSYIALFDDFHPIKSAEVPENAQQQIYDFMYGVMQTLYEDPSLLSLPADPDECEDRPAEGKRYLDTRKIMRSITKKIEDFLALLHNIGKTGVIEQGNMIVPHKDIKLNKAKCEILKKIGLEYTIQGEQCSLSSASYPALAEAWSYLGRNTDSLMLFSHAEFREPDDYAFSLLKKLLRENQPDLLKYIDYFMQNGYRFSWNTNKASEICGFDFRKNVSGFLIHFDRRFYRQIDFHVINHINYKAMLEDFDRQTDTLKTFMVQASRKCSQCMQCTKGNPKVKPFYQDVIFNGQPYQLCPSFPKFDWKEVSDDLMEQIIECIEMQEKYDVK